MTLNALATKFKPKSLDEVVGQDGIIRSLKYSIRSDRTHHSYCFIGARGTGKTTTARIFAKGLNCLGGMTATPCNRCTSCLDVDNAQNIDHLEVDAASHRGVEEMANLLRGAVYVPFIARYKVYIIDEAHLLTTHAFSSMLKILEEPPAHVKFILCSTDVRKIPLTILSRSMNLYFHLINRSELERFITSVLRSEGIMFDQEIPGQICYFACGSVRDALSSADRVIISSNGRTITKAIVERALGVPKMWVVFRILRALSRKDIRSLLSLTHIVDHANLPAENIMNCVLSVLTKISVWQADPSIVEWEGREFEYLKKIGSLPTLAVPKVYQIILDGLREIREVSDQNAVLLATAMRAVALIS